MNTKSISLLFGLFAVFILQPAFARQADEIRTRTEDSQSAQERSASNDDGQDESENLGTITVTANKRTQLKQDVPATLNIVTSKDIETAGLTTASDLEMLVPGFNFMTLPAQGASNVVVRGLSTTIGEPNVSFFVDGVYIPSRYALDFLLAGNIARVEVAKGPQYALYGQNSFAGAVNFVTKAPSDEVGGSVMVGAGNHGQREVRVIASGPFAEGSSYHWRVGVDRNEFDGFYTNELTADSLDDSRRTGGFLTLTGAPTNRLSGRFNIIYNRAQQGDYPARFVSNNGHFFPPLNDYQMYYGALPSLTDRFAVTPGHHDTESVLSSLKLNYDLNGATLTSVTSYNHLDVDNYYDSDHIPARVQMAGTEGPQTSIAEDLRLVSHQGGDFDWLIGLYYYHYTNDHVDKTLWVGPAAPIFGGLISDNHETTRSTAIYASGTWHISPEWDLGVVLRQTHETKSIDVTTKALPAVTNPTGSVTSFHASSTFTPFTPGVNVAWKPTRDMMFYASAVKAIKVGGFNTFTVNGAIAPDERAYDPETSVTYELGAKFTPLDGHMVLDVAAYKINWSDQIVRTVGSLGALLNTNAGRTTSKGLEFTMQYRPDRNWSFRLGATYNDAEYDKYIFPVVASVGLDPDLSGVRLQYAPRTTANASVLYQMPFNNGWQWSIRVDGRYRAEMNAVQTGAAYTPATTLVNLRTSFDFGASRISLWVDNVSNEDGAASAVFATSPATQLQFATGRRAGMQLFQPLVMAPRLRTFGIEYRYSF